ERDAAADALHRLEQAEPLALAGIGEAEQLEAVLAHLGLDEQRRGLADQERGQGAARARHQIADAVDVDDRPVLADRIDDPAQLGDHARTAAAPSPPRGEGWGEGAADNACWIAVRTPSSSSIS